MSVVDCDGIRHIAAMHPLPPIPSNLTAPSGGIVCDSDIFLHSMYGSPVCADSSCDSGSNSVDDKATACPSMSPSTASAAFLEQQKSRAVPQSGSAALLSASSAVTIEASALDELLQEKTMKQERLARKAQLARINRKRKKQRMSELQDEVDALKKELALERKRHRSGPPPLESLSAAASAPASPLSGSVSVSGEQQQQHMLRSAVEELVMCTRRLSSPSAAVSPQAIQEVADGAKQVLLAMQNVEQSKLDSVRSLMQMLQAPSNIGFLQWLMSRSDMSFYTDPDSMWQSLFRDHIGLSPQQLEALEALRADMSEQRRISTDIKNSVHDLEQKLIPHLQQQQRSLDSIASILDPEQLARFFVWVNDNQLCVKLLQNVS